METKQKLDDLPKSEDKDFWLDAEIHMGLIAKENPLDIHYFVRVSGRQAQCKNCDWGFELDPGDRIENGHLYERTGKLVI
jgi:hypothetical protein